MRKKASANPWIDPKLKEERDRRLEELRVEQDIRNHQENLTRARSITVGTCFGGTTEITMRGSGSTYLFCIMQPVEVIELIHQLAANVGCHLQLQPRQDFSSWRDWKYDEQTLLHYRGGVESHLGVGHAPHVNDMAPHQSKGQVLPPPEQQPGMKASPELRNNENVMAIKENINQPTIERAPEAS